MNMPLAKRPPCVSHKDDRATWGRGSRVRAFQLHEELDIHAPFQRKEVYGVLAMGLTGSLAAPGSTLDCMARTSGA